MRAWSYARPPSQDPDHESGQMLTLFCHTLNVTAHLFLGSIKYLLRASFSGSQLRATADHLCLLLVTNIVQVFLAPSWRSAAILTGKRVSGISKSHERLGRVISRQVDAAHAV